MFDQLLIVKVSCIDECYPTKRFWVLGFVASTQPTQIFRVLAKFANVNLRNTIITMILPLIVRNRATQDIRQHANYILIIGLKF